MSDESSVDAMMAASSLSEKVWDLSSRTVQLFSAAAQVAADLQYYNEVPDNKEAAATAREAVDRIGDLIKSVARIRQQESLLRYFALAYKERLGGCYVLLKSGKSVARQRVGDDRPLETSPLDFHHRSYTDKALDLVDQLLDTLRDVGSDVASIAAAVPFLLDLTFDSKLVDEFVAELRQEAVRAAELVAGDGGGDALAPRRERQLALSNSKPRQQEHYPSGLTDNALAVLICLRNRSPQLLTLEDIMDRTKLSRDTVCTVVNELIDNNLAHRPQGKRKGATITDKGRVVAELIKSDD